MDDAFITTLLLTFKLASVTTILLLLIGIPLGYWLARTKLFLKPFIETIIAMPLVLPPTVIGFYLLLLFSPQNAFGSFLQETFDIKLVFSYEGLVIASVIYSLPFMVHPIQSGFSALPFSLEEASFTLGKSRWTTLRRILLPNIKASLLTGIVLSFAHTVGEFGVVLMIGGSLPGETRVASIAIYEEVEALHYGMANNYSLVLVAVSFAVLFSVYALNKRLAGSVK